jgi:hypothetical protein
VSHTRSNQQQREERSASSPSALSSPKEDDDKVRTEACGDVSEEDEEIEQEEMFVDPHESFEHQNVREWNGPRRGGRYPEPTRYGDWERKGRCSDF